MNNSQLAHNWFHSVKQEQKSGSMFYEGNAIYSYGYHYPIAVKNENTVLVNDNSYSNTTAKHRVHVLRAIDSATHKIIHVPLKAKRVYDFLNNVDFNELENRIRHNVRKLATAKKPSIYIGQIESIQETCKSLQALGMESVALDSILAFKLSNDIIEKAKIQQAKEKEAEKARIQKRKEDTKIQLQKFLNHEAYSVHGLELLNLDTVIRLAKDGQAVETSKGMKIPLNTALLILKAWESGKALGMQVHINEYNYVCTLANDNTIKFGCHVINKAQAIEVLKPILN